MKDFQDIRDQYDRREITLAQYWDLLKEVAKQEKRKDDYTLKEPPRGPDMPLTVREKDVIKKMQSVSFGSFGPHRKFIKQIEKVGELTARQKEYLRKLFFRYRRQLKLSDVEALNINKEMEKDAKAYEP